MSLPFSAYTRTQAEMPYFSSGVTMLPGQSKTLPDVASMPAGASLTVTKRLFIDGRDRYGYPASAPFDFKVYFGNDPERSVGIAGYDNVMSVELKAIALPKVANERYVVVSIAELNDNMLEASSSAINDTFAIVYFDSDALATGAVKPLKGIDFYQKVLQFKPPLAKLNSLSIKFLKHDGTVVTAADTNGETHVSLLFEITSKVARSG